MAAVRSRQHNDACFRSRLPIPVLHPWALTSLLVYVLSIVHGRHALTGMSRVDVSVRPAIYYLVGQVRPCASMPGMESWRRMLSRKVGQSRAGWGSHDYLTLLAILPCTA
ncbi:hypothetical protein B0T19DRAFT_138641 [Cercophora scortea]|uniref:Uncharacterized protein n=1 Tax=Cercophora scortea TaxID=314031 RepID=A0AAE0MJX7_9PEZI|nr:hypothetical protein B0T19DRAFT_138641 [Cercophora scortea]